MKNIQRSGIYPLMEEEYRQLVAVGVDGLTIYHDVYPVKDKDLVQIMLALRLFIPRAGIAISARKSQGLRDHLIPLGVTKISAGVSTEVGGHSSDARTESQFEISDKRNVKMISHAILSRGYQPIFKDWMKI